MMSTRKKNLIQILLCSFFLYACAYIVTPAADLNTGSSTGKGWSALVTNVGASSAGDLHIDIAIRNDTGDWSTMQATAGHPAMLTVGGKTKNCDTVFVSTGGNRLAPGFQMRGFTSGTKSEPKTQLLYVECKGASAAPGSKLSVEYGYVTGPYNYYVSAIPVNATLELNLDQVAKDLKYPFTDAAPDLIEKASGKITAINDCVLTLTDVKRTDAGLEFAWETKNPGTYPTYVHIGTPPVIASDGILYVFMRTRLSQMPPSPCRARRPIGRRQLRFPRTPPVCIFW